MSRVNPVRRYESPRRREQAAATRRDILLAAQRLFEEHGYAATTVAAIAGEARVSVKTVYDAFETKSGVLRALWNLILRENEERPIAEHPRYRAVLDADDPEEQLRLNARNSRAAKERLAGIFTVIRQATPIEPEIAGLWDRIQTEYHANQRTIVRSLATKCALRPGLGIDRATDILWTINHPDTWQLLVEQRRWTPSAYERWCATLACTQLLA